MVENKKPRRPQWGPNTSAHYQQSFGREDDPLEKPLPGRDTYSDANKVIEEDDPIPGGRKRGVALDIGLDNDQMMNDAKMRKFEEFKARQRMREEQRK